MPSTTAEFVRAWHERIGAVPSADNDFVCACCLGPVTNYTRCFGCFNLFNRSGAPSELRDAVVPMSTALSPSAWYTVLASYKGLQPNNGAVVASVAYHFLDRHEQSISRMLGGDATILTIVPSKRGISYEEQPLRRSLARVQEFRNRLRQTLIHNPGARSARQEYTPDAFRAGPVSVDGERVALIEDTWVTGGTAVSAAGKLLELGAESVVILPIARRIDAGFWEDEHPYRRAMTMIAPLLSTNWPR